MRCPRCGGLGQEVPTAAEVPTPGDTARVYLCSTPGCRVIQYDTTGIQAEAPEEDPRPEA